MARASKSAERGRSDFKSRGDCAYVVDQDNRLLGVGDCGSGQAGSRAG